MSRHRVVIVGAGFGGLNVAKALAKAPVDITLVDANNFHTFQPLLYQVATAGLDGDDIASAVRGIFHRQPNVDFRLATAVGADLAGRRLLVEPGPPIEYDTLVVAAGAVTATYDIPGVSEYAFGLKSLADAQRLRSHVLLQFERAATQSGHVDDGALTVVVAGGGPTGVELAGGLQELFSMVLAKDYPRLDVRRAHVVLVEMADRVLGTFAPHLSSTALHTLRSRGIEVVLGVGVDKVEPGAVHLSDGNRINTRTLVWTAGVKASPLGGALGLPTARGGRVAVGADLSVEGHPDVFVIGDLAGSVDRTGQLLPQVAPVAMQGGRHVARQIQHRLNDEPTKAFRYRDKGSMATIGRRAAVAELPGGIRFAGTLGWLSWLGLHLVMLIGFRNRANVLVNWAWNYVTYDRGARLIAGVVDPADAEMAPSGPPTPAEPPPIERLQPPEAAAAGAGAGPVDQQNHHGADDRAHEAGRLQRALPEVVPEQDVAEEAADEAADDAEQDRAGDADRVGTGHEKPTEEPGNRADDQEVQKESEHGSPPVGT